MSRASYLLIDEPDRFGDTLRMWEDYLAQVSELSNDSYQKGQLVEQVREMIRIKKAENTGAYASYGEGRGEWDGL